MRKTFFAVSLALMVILLGAAGWLVVELYDAKTAMVQGENQGDGSQVVSASETVKEEIGMVKERLDSIKGKLFFTVVVLVCLGTMAYIVLRPRAPEE